jgi:hypothetical protein
MIAYLFKRTFGALALLIGLGIGAWFVYNQFWATAEFQHTYRSPIQLAVPIACIVVGWKWLWDEGKGIEEITQPELKCPELEEGVKAALESLPYFLEQVSKNTHEAYIKFPLTTPGGMTEHIWAYVHFFRDDLFNVSLANEPIDGLQAAAGRRDVHLSQVEDWQIIEPDGRIKGLHSLIALFRYHENRGLKLSPKMKKQKALLIDA